MNRWLQGVVALLLLAPCGCLAQGAWPLWDQYARRFLDGQGRIVDHTAGDRTTSEGQAYAMFFALLANDKPRLAQMLRWTEANLAKGDLAAHLPAWHWGRAQDGAWRVLDANSASDADLWMAYTLLEAGRLWKDPHYDRLGRSMAARIAREEMAVLPGFGATLLPGPVGFHPDARTWILNPSYLPPSLLEYFAKAGMPGRWDQARESLGEMLSHGSGNGFVMDWVAAGGGTRPSLAPADLARGKKGEQTAVGAYEAIRVYLWLGLADPDTPGVREMLGQAAGMATYLKTHPYPPSRVNAKGEIVDAEAPPGFSAAVLPYLCQLGLQVEAKRQEDRLLAVKDPVSGLYGKEAAYYDQNLALFGLGWREGRFRFDRGGRLVTRWK